MALHLLSMQDAKHLGQDGADSTEILHRAAGHFQLKNLARNCVFELRLRLRLTWLVAWT